VSFTHTLTQSYATNVGTVTSATLTFTGDSEDDLDVAVPANATNQNYAIQFNKTALQSILITCDQAVTIKTNSSSSPQDTINLGANTPVIWYAASGATSPFAGNVTGIYVTNPANVAANLKIRGLENY
jgi:hypothetical protein